MLAWLGVGICGEIVDLHHHVDRLYEIFMTEPIANAIFADQAHGVIRLGGCHPIGRGSERVVYAHPRDPTLLLKVLVGKDLATRRVTFETIALRMFPKALRMRRTLKELESYRRAFLRNEIPAGTCPAAEFRGFYATDLGAAMGFEMVRGADGAPARPIGELPHSERSSPDMRALLKDFASKLVDWQLIASDLNLGNIVLADRGAGPELVLIDGMGAPHLVPLRYWSRRINRRELMTRLDRLAGEIGMNFDRRSLEFSPADRIRPRRSPRHPRG